MKKSAVWLIAAVAAVGWSGMVGRRALTQSSAPSIDVERLGPKVGEPVPDFNLPDQHGTTRSLKSLMGPKGLVLVFFRSADW